MLERIFFAWERRLATVTTDRVVRPFEWGLDWIDTNGHPPAVRPESVLRDWVDRALSDTQRFFDAPATSDFDYSTGVAPFKYFDGLILARFLNKSL